MGIGQNKLRTIGQNKLRTVVSGKPHCSTIVL